MKRSGPLRRRTPLQARTPLQPGTSQLKRTPLARGTSQLARTPARRTRSDEERAAAAAWAPRPGERCAVCGGAATEDNPLEGHHVVAKGRLEKMLPPGSSPAARAALLWDVRNRMPVHRSRHTSHTRRTRGRLIPYTALSAANRAFAAQHGLTWYLQRYYPAP